MSTVLSVLLVIVGGVFALAFLVGVVLVPFHVHAMRRDVRLMNQRLGSLTQLERHAAKLVPLAQMLAMDSREWQRVKAQRHADTTERTRVALDNEKTQRIQ